MNFDNFHKEIKKGQIQSCLIFKQDTPLFVYYKNKKAETSIHQIHSCSKSVTSMVMGICLKNHYIENLDEPIIDFFPDYKDCFDENKEKITIRHLLTMSEGLDWPEFGEWNCFAPMEFSKNIIRFILKRKLCNEPGTHMNYNSGCSHLLCSIMQKASGLKVFELATDHLFQPLGISKIIWNEKQGVSLGANGIQMVPADMLKLGELYLHKGVHKKKVLIPAAWIEESTKPILKTYNDIGAYGHHWWTSEFKSEDGRTIPYYFAMGLFGQFIIIIPDYEIVTVITSDNYGDSFKPMNYFRKYVLPEIGGMHYAD